MVIPYLFLPIGFALLGLQYALLFKRPEKKAPPEAGKTAEAETEAGQQI
jgi:TRAP-type C4-dicarboxylate transport system permease small subunit